MAGNLTAFQLGPGAVISLETNQGQVLALVGNADAQSYNAPGTYNAIGFSGLYVADQTNWVFTVDGSGQPSNPTVVLTGLPAGRPQWLQIRTVQSQYPAGGITISYPNPYPTVSKVPGAVPLTLTPTAGATDIISLYWDGATLYSMIAAKDFR